MKLLAHRVNKVPSKTNYKDEHKEEANAMGAFPRMTRCGVHTQHVMSKAMNVIIVLLFAHRK